MHYHLMESPRLEQPATSAAAKSSDALQPRFKVFNGVPMDALFDKMGNKMPGVHLSLEKRWLLHLHIKDEHPQMIDGFLAW